MAAKDTSRQTQGVMLPPEVSGEIWAKAIEESAVMQLATKIPLLGQGKEFQTITGDPEASWVSETEKIATGKHTFGKKSMKGYKLGVIEPFSLEFKRDKAALYDACVNRLPKAIGVKFDKTVFGVEGSAPGESFDTLAGAAAVDVETDPWLGLVTADAAISAADGMLDGWALAPAAKTSLLTAKDGMQRPLFVNSMVSDNSVPALMGHPAHVKKGVYKAPVPATSSADGVPAQLGFGGEWASAFYGIVEGVRISITEDATITIDGQPFNLWEHDMFAVKVMFEAGFIVKDIARFAKLVGKTPKQTA